MQLSISVGSALLPADGTTGQALLSRADNAMYRGKVGRRSPV